MKVFKMISDIKIGNIFLPNTNVVILISQMLSVACKIKCCQSAIGSSHILKTSIWRPKNNNDFFFSIATVSVCSNHTTDKRQMSGPNLHVFTLKFLALKNWFFHFFGVKNFFWKKCYKKGIMQLLSADPKKVKNGVFYD